MRFQTKDILLSNSAHQEIIDEILGDSFVSSGINITVLDSLDFQTQQIPLALRIILEGKYTRPGNEDFLEIIRNTILKAPKFLSNKASLDELSLIQLHMLINNYNDPDLNRFITGDISQAIESIDEIIDKHELTPLVLDLSEIHDATPLKTLESLPEQERWRLYIDGNKQRDPLERGWQAYEEREKNCILSMHNSFKYALSEHAKPLTVDTIMTIHDIALGGIEGDMIQGLRDRGTHTAFDYLSLDRVMQVPPYAETKKYDSTLGIKSNYIKRSFEYTSPKDLINFMKNTLLEYENKLSEAGDSIEGKLDAIVDLGYDMLKKHPFCDGNSRTFITIILNKELMRNGFSACIFDDPLIFEGYVGRNELKLEVINGIKNFKKLIAENTIENLPPNLTTKELSKQASPPILSSFSADEMLTYTPKKPKR
ncbi:Fic family protein [Candidatus Berkiella cookevillensis]|uniref:Fic family protein n=1 Tax=Candidatus Berkiella cookevillensis TaxID=437022 RepID=A0A0Q9YFV3_9GAMM|nr:Fic family protein [Candidatus Berkiella cookevillensis]MCS5707916.1 Fic family protein [Candidatus Berkiella cookevillensis]